MNEYPLKIEVAPIIYSLSPNLLPACTSRNVTSYRLFLKVQSVGDGVSYW